MSKIAAAGLIITIVLIAMPLVVHAQDGDLDEEIDDEIETELEEELEEFEPGAEIPRRDLDDIGEETAVEIAVERTLSLAEARELVVEEHYDVRLAMTQLEVADGVIRQAYSALLPTFSASGNYTVNQEEIIADLGGGEDMPPGAESPEFVVQPKTDYRWSVSASVGLNLRSWPLIQQAQAQRELASAEVEVVREALDDAVVQSYFNLLMVRRTIDLASHQVESARVLRESTQSRLDAGTATEFDLTRADLELHQRTQQLQTARLQFIQVRKALAELLQTDADFDILRPDSPSLPGEDVDLIARAEEERAVFQTGELNEEVAYWGVRDVFYSYLPSLNATFTYAGSRGTDLQPGDPQWVLTFGAEWIIWDGGMREAQHDQARAQLVAAEIQSEQTRHEVDSEIDQAISEVDAARAQVESAEIEVELAERGLQQAEASFRYGVASQLDVITARDQYQLAQLSLIQERLQVDLSVYRVLTLTEGR